MKPEQCPHCRAPESYLEKIGRVWVCQCCSKVVNENR
jgi:ribosomal protein L37AE/L43A